MGLPAAALLLGMTAAILPTRQALRAGRGSVTAAIE